MKAKRKKKPAGEGYAYAFHGSYSEKGKGGEQGEEAWRLAHQPGTARNQ